MVQNFSTVTEIAGDDVTTEQVERLSHRYFWAANFCKDKDVLEIACGNGQGLGYLGTLAKSVHAGDIDKNLVAQAKSHYGDRFSIEVMDAQDLPFEENSLDIIILFEALYYIPDPDKFMQECVRVLREDGKVLIATANKDLFDFNPSPYSHKYFGVVELTNLMNQHGMTTSLFGYCSVKQASALQKIARPLKKFIISFGLMPKTMAGKKILKRLFFGQLIPMPAEIKKNDIDYLPPIPLEQTIIDQNHKVIYCVGNRHTS